MATNTVVRPRIDKQIKEEAAAVLAPTGNWRAGRQTSRLGPYRKSTAAEDYEFQKRQRRSAWIGVASGMFLVARGGIEAPTQGFSIIASDLGNSLPFPWRPESRKSRVDDWRIELARKYQSAG